MILFILNIYLAQSVSAQSKPVFKKNRIKPIEVALPDKPANIESNLWNSTPTSDQFSTQKKTGGVRIEDIVEPVADYHYASFGNSDPFVPPLLAAPQIHKIVESKSILSPLQKYPASELKISGVWETDEGEWKALVMTRDGEGIVVRKADPFGDKDGKITNISEEGLNIREYVKSLDGTREMKEFKILLSAASVSPEQGSIQPVQLIERFQDSNPVKDQIKKDIVIPQKEKL